MHPVHRPETAAGRQWWWAPRPEGTSRPGSREIVRWGVPKPGLRYGCLGGQGGRSVQHDGSYQRRPLREGGGKIPVRRRWDARTTERHSVRTKMLRFAGGHGVPARQSPPAEAPARHRPLKGSQAPGQPEAQICGSPVHEGTPVQSQWGLLLSSPLSGQVPSNATRNGPSFLDLALAATAQPVRTPVRVPALPAGPPTSPPAACKEGFVRCRPCSQMGR